MHLNNKIELGQVENKVCETIGSMDDNLIELSYILHRTTIHLNENKLELKKTYKYFNRNEYNLCYDKFSEVKRDIQIIRRKIELLESKIDDCTLPDSAPCFYFKQYFDDIMDETIKLKEKYYNLINKISCKLLLLEN